MDLGLSFDAQSVANMSVLETSDVLHPDVPQEPVAGTHDLSGIEVEVLSKVAEGVSVEEIASSLNVSEITVQLIANMAKRKLGTHTLVESAKQLNSQAFRANK